MLRLLGAGSPPVGVPPRSCEIVRVGFAGMYSGNLYIFSGSGYRAVHNTISRKAEIAAFRLTSISSRPPVARSGNAEAAARRLRRGKAAIASADAGLVAVHLIRWATRTK